MLLADFDHPVMWLILLLAVFCYYRLLQEILLYRSRSQDTPQQSWGPSLGTLITTLPLLGLLGTISGLLQTFFAMSLGHSIDSSALLTEGISDALLTTQFGLLTAIPGWLLLSLLHYYQRGEDQP